MPFVVLCFKYARFTMQNRDRPLAVVSDFFDDVLIVAVTMVTPVKPSRRPDSDLRYLLLYNLEEYICLHVTKVDLLRLPMMPTGETLVMRPGFEKQEMAFASCSKRWKRRSGRPNQTSETHVSFTDTPSASSYEEVEYESLLASLMTQLQPSRVVPENSIFQLWYGVFIFRGE